MVSLPALAIVNGNTVTAIESSANKPSLHFKLIRNLYKPASYPLTLVTRLLGELIKTEGPEIWYQEDTVPFPIKPDLAPKSTIESFLQITELIPAFTEQFWAIETKPVLRKKANNSNNLRIEICYLFTLISGTCN